MKTNEKKSSKVIAALMGLTLLSGAVAPSTSHAFVGLGDHGEGVTNWMVHPHDRDRQSVTSVFANLIMCAALLPICLLDEKQDGSVNPSRAQLVENGYTAEEIALIEQDQKKLSTILAEKNQKLSVAKKDTRESIQAEIKSLHPQVSAVYLDFVTDSVGLGAAE